MIVFEGPFKGWYLIRGVLGFDNEKYIKKIAVFYHDRCEYISFPVTKKGLINFVFEIKENAQKLIVCPDEEVSQIKPVQIKKITALESLFRMYRRIFPLFFDKNLPNLELVNALKLNLTKAIFKPRKTYYSISFARAKRLSQVISYEDWIKENDTLTDIEREKLIKKAGSIYIKVSLLIPWVDDLNLTNNTVESIKRQIYERWELFIFTENKEIYQRLRDTYADDERIEIGISEKPFESFLELLEGEFLGIVFQGDRLSEKALISMLECVDEKTLAIYSDNDFLINDKGVNPQFKPDWNYEYFLHYDYIQNLILLRKREVLNIGGFNEKARSYVIYDALLRFSEKIEKKRIKHVPMVLYHSVNEKRLEDWDNGLEVLTKNLAKKEKVLEVKKGEIPHTFRIVYKIPSNPPLVSIVIPTKDKCELLKTCINSILKKTTYPNYEVIVVDNGSSEKDTLDFLKEISRLKNFKILRHDIPFNFSKLVNAGVSKAQGSYVVLLNNDVEVISEDWIEGMLSYASMENVGAVGGKLLYPDGKVQHAGVVVGLYGVADHAFKGINKDEPGYMYRAVLPQELLAVTAACMMFRRVVFEKVKGFDEAFAVNFNDTDFCLKLIENGFRVIFNPFVLLYHHEHATRGQHIMERTTIEQAQRERKEFAKRWWEYILRDPFYNPNLSRYRNDFSIGISNNYNSL